MTLSPGTRLGPYEIASPIGAGGMGEVYRARDSRLGRDVAVKVLPEDFLEGEEGKQRFEREARALASLNHPNVAVVHSFEESGGRHILVMELLEGTTLRERLDSGPIPPKQAVDYALQIAKGLSAAHEKGIVHRDLKPENLFVTKDGHLKILDFGLAKRTEQQKPGDETSAPTESKHTEPGTVMGTVAYMSPEQVRGLPVDHRSDIFSFGAIFYELLSGKKAFKRDTASDTMAAIMRDEPPELSESGRNISPALDRVVKHCLEKDRSNRFQSAKDIAFALSEASGQAMSSGAQVTAPTSGKTKTLIAAAAIVVLAAAGIFLMRRSGGTATEAKGPKRIAVLPFENMGAAEDGYFADGMTDEVRSKLAGLSGLAVIASGSSGQYKATTKPPEQIAKELGVGYLLVAKVRWQKSGQASRIRVSPELVDVSSGSTPTTRWQEAFDADLSDVFKVQGEIASKVAKSLDVVLSGKERGSLTALPTSNLAAYDAYLKGMEILKKQGFFLKSAAAQFDQAVALDPGFALAWARSSMSHTQAFTNTDPSPQRAEAAKLGAERAVELAPGLPLATVALAGYHASIRRNEARAVEILSRALKSAPDDVDLLGAVAGFEPDFNKRLELLRRVQDLDPRGRGIHSGLARTLQDLRRISEARAECDRGLALAPGDLNMVRVKAMTYLQEGDLAGARALIAAAPKEIGPTELVAYFGAMWDLDWVLDDAQRALLLRLTPASFFEGDRGAWGIVLAQAASRRGEQAKVREYAEEARKWIAAELAAGAENAQNRVGLGLSLAYLGRKEEAVREGEKAVSAQPIPTGGQTGSAYAQHQLVRIHILCGNYEKAIDLLEPLLKVPYYLTPAWLRIDPNFDPLRKNPRFQKLVAGK